MNWLIRIADASDYLAGLGADPVTIQWIMSQPDPQFYVNEYRKNPGIDVTSLQPPQKQVYEPTYRELQRVNIFPVVEQGIKNWSLVQLKKFRVRPNPLSNGDMDYDYSIGMTEFDNKLRQMGDWYRTLSYDLPGGEYIDIASYTWDQAWAATEEWHRQQAAEGENLVYDQFDPSLTMFGPKEWGGWFIQKVVSENDLIVEGNRMEHCVGSYCRQVQGGRIEIYSLRDPQNKPHVTIEFTPEYDEIDQIMGKSNSEPKDEYKKLIGEWFVELKKSKPDLAIGSEELFNFDQLSEFDNMVVDEKIMEIAYQGNEYGLEPPLDQLDIQHVYDGAISAMTSWRGNDMRNVQHIGRAISEVAWAADKARAAKFDLTVEDQFFKFKFKSKREGVDWLHEKTQENSEDWNDGWFDYEHESYVSREDFETDEAYEQAVDEERWENESQSRSKSMPSALDDVIMGHLAELARTDPFLEEHKAFLPQEQLVAQKKNWLQLRIA